MPFRVSGKNIEVGEALRERIGARIHEALEKYFDGGFSGHVTVGKEAFGFCTECVVHLDSGIVLRAELDGGGRLLSAPIKPRKTWKSGCAATIAGSRTIMRRTATTAVATGRPAPMRRRAM